MVMIIIMIIRVDRSSNKWYTDVNKIYRHKREERRRDEGCIKMRRQKKKTFLSSDHSMVQKTHIEVKIPNIMTMHEGKKRSRQKILSEG